MKNLNKIFAFLLVISSLLQICIISASATTINDATEWLKAQNGIGYDLDNSYGCQCSDFATAYMNWCINGNPRGGNYPVVNANYYPTLASSDPNNWEVIKNYSDFIPKPGDIFIVTGSLPQYGHVGVVLNSTLNKATVIDQNYDSKAYAYIHDISWGVGSYIPTHFIRYRGFNNTSNNSNTTTTRIPNGTYYFKNVATGLYMNLAYGKDVNEQNIHAHEFAGYDSQKMFAWHLGENRYAIRPVGVATRIINANAWDIVSGTNVNLFDDSGDPTQHWYFEKSGDSYIIHNVSNYNCVITVDSDLNVIVENNSNNANQKWILECVTHTFDNDSDASCNQCPFVREIKKKTEVVLKIGKKEATVNGNKVKNDVAPIAEDSRTMLPARFVAEVLGASVDWDSKNSTVIIKGKDVEIKIPIGSKNATVNGETKKLDVPAFAKNGRTFTPVRFIVEALGAVVNWNGDSQTITIIK
ncbi:MAG: CHAP domain-containing protein [Clostridia bacterium]|nr:CHAP domain-containing protein [Clostridia bacterium]